MLNKLKISIYIKTNIENISDESKFKTKKIAAIGLAA
jgi:hypothetical protein